MRFQRATARNGSEKLRCGNTLPAQGYTLRMKANLALLVVGAAGLLACSSRPPAAPMATADSTPAPAPVAGDLDGDRVPDVIEATHSGGAHCCTSLAVTLSSCGTRIALPFRIDAGLYEVIDPDGDGVSSMLVTTHTYNAERFPLEPEITTAWGIRANDVLVHFSECQVSMEDLPNHLFGPAAYLARYRASAPLAVPFQASDGRFGYRDAAANEVVPAVLSAAGPVRFGRAVVQCSPSELAIIDTRGAIVRELADIQVLDDAPAFNDGLLLAMRGDRMGYLGVDGEWAIEPRYADARPFQDGVAAVEHGDKWGYIDRTGRWVFPPRFDLAFSFEGGKAGVMIRGAMRELDRTSGQLSALRQ